MTIAAGFKCANGIVLGTDGQYTAGSLKTQGQKLFTISRDAFTLCIAGAGTVAFIKMAVGVLEAKLDAAKPQSIPQIKVHVETTLHEIFNRHVYPVPDSIRPELGMVIGAWTPPANLQLWQTDLTAVNSVAGDYACIGVGQDLGTYVTDLLFQSGSSTEHVKVLAAYVLKTAKDYVSDCGKNTSILVLNQNGKADPVPATLITEAENYFSGLSEMMKVFLTGLDTRLDDDMVGMFADLLKDGLIEFRKQQKENTDKVERQAERIRLLKERRARIG